MLPASENEKKIQPSVSAAPVIWVVAFILPAAETSTSASVRSASAALTPHRFQLKDLTKKPD